MFQNHNVKPWYEQVSLEKSTTVFENKKRNDAYKRLVLKKPIEAVESK